MPCYELSIETHFSAAHQLRGYPGDCARLHGHNWHVKLFVECHELDELGLAIDYKILKKELKSALEPWDHYNLNDIPPFDSINPSSENVARELFISMTQRLNNERIKVSCIEIAETCTAKVRYSES
ncbi:MAG: 6-carboxytetrahydropterin synthase QueD [Zetaproteobacteria bacterium CG_4_9_14_3_um_filter_49_83]|nr:MAG: 6-carboxytetrahydropterin synthase QueD [Zetaproteobacteria bacterium CG1_02_49_23]PIQ31553.1 MAG: 6-carboxytetrahydropterin synthase QueD [Zetaproteobacteria bacterium CG17_big_fil_post_rev_8_21_14_2_50_50_13]PIV31582.1 MAG: 6-carboxytetrahydropterin synthase QueD [Zetaproteobacteria bacterium CG02_land_8_20_14_3_00_50_9]PIY54567.1 MAG: 6-carboxytetrahydropterin synthase QueD [Zetaproteobacteria bacterium CG_4_10_14_0_8_um_filter_49_80]PJA35704.1 MAG: 6-carboxytetrahydropterin synthase